MSLSAYPNVGILMNDPYFNVSETNQACLDIDINGGFQVDPAAELHQGAQGDLHQCEGQPQKGDFDHSKSQLLTAHSTPR